ncbi:MAG: dihydrofolate reductase, partial [Opitutus sp.]
NPSTPKPARPSLPMPKLLNLIAACAENRVIGRKGRLPWRIPEDANFFRDQTAGQICVMGRICYDSWPAVHADGRRPIVLTNHPLDPARTPAGHAPIIAGSLAEALATAELLPGEIYLCGGQRVYEETLALYRPMRLHLTLVHTEVPGDTYFPEWRHLPWHETSRRESADANYRYTFLTLDRG